MNTRTQSNTQVTLTVGEVRRRQAVTKEDASGFGHLQVDHVGGVLQGCDSLFMAHLLQTGAVHLHTHTHTHTTESVNTGNWPTGRKGADSHSQQLVSDLQPPVLVGSASFDDLGHVDAVVARDVLVSDTASDAKAQTWTRTEGDTPSGWGAAARNIGCLVLFWSPVLF